MESSGNTLVVLLCVLFSSQKRISGAELEVMVRRGDDVTLYSDCVVNSGSNPAWIRNCSHDNQPPLVITTAFLIDYMRSGASRYSFVWNHSSTAHDLLIKNVTEADLGVFYCAVHETVLTDHIKGHLAPSVSYGYGNRSTRLSLLEEASTWASDPGVPGWCVSWQVLVVVGTLCAILSSLFSSVCVYCLIRNSAKAEPKVNQRGNGHMQALRSDEVGQTEVCYSSLDFQNFKQKKQKQRVQHSDISTYSEVRTQRI